MLKSCGKCGVLKYCSKLFQKRHYRRYQKICDAIFHFSNQQKKEVVKMGQYNRTEKQKNRRL